METGSQWTAYTAIYFQFVRLARPPFVRLTPSKLNMDA
jgi:hypothetical protein